MTQWYLCFPNGMAIEPLHDCESPGMFDDSPEVVGRDTELIGKEGNRWFARKCFMQKSWAFMAM